MYHPANNYAHRAEMAVADAYFMRQSERERLELDYSCHMRVLRMYASKGNLTADALNDFLQQAETMDLRDRVQAAGQLVNSISEDINKRFRESQSMSVSLPQAAGGEASD